MLLQSCHFIDIFFGIIIIYIRTLYFTVYCDLTIHVRYNMLVLLNVLLSISSVFELLLRAYYIYMCVYRLYNNIAIYYLNTSTSRSRHKTCRIFRIFRIIFILRFFFFFSVNTLRGYVEYTDFYIKYLL